MTEKWRKIPSLPDYLASSHGRVMCLPYLSKISRTGPRQYGGVPTHGVTHPYNGMRPTIQYRGKNYRVSRLVCEAFHGAPPYDGAVVMHLDDNQMNNRPENLKWGTQKENLNSEKFIAYCRSRVGDNSPRAKWVAKQVAAE